MNKFLVIIFISVMMSSANATVYHFYDGEKLAEAALEWQKSQTHPKDSDLLLVSSYAGYVGAIFDHLSEKQYICAPDEMTKNDVLSVVAEYMKNTRKSLKLSGSVLVQKALIKKYSCN